MKSLVPLHCQCLLLTNPFCVVSYFLLFLRNQLNNQAPLPFAPNLQIEEHSAMEPLSTPKVHSLFQNLNQYLKLLLIQHPKSSNHKTIALCCKNRTNQAQTST